MATDPSKHHNAACHLREEHTGAWFLKSPEYKRWKSGDTSLLWTFGIPGSGKTVLFSRVVEDITAYCKTHAGCSTLYAYYYCDFGKNQDESGNILRWTINQLARQTDDIPREILEAYQQDIDPTISTLMRGLGSFCTQAEKVYLLIDGIDESCGRADLLLVLDKLREPSFGNLRVLVMSREEADIRRALKPYAELVSLSNQDVDEDIVYFIRRQLERHPRLQLYPPDLKREIERVLSDGADGMYVLLDMLSFLSRVFY